MGKYPNAGASKTLLHPHESTNKHTNMPLTLADPPKRTCKPHPTQQHHVSCRFRKGTMRHSLYAPAVQRTQGYAITTDSQLELCLEQVGSAGFVLALACVTWSSWTFRAKGLGSLPRAPGSSGPKSKLRRPGPLPPQEKASGRASGLQERADLLANPRCPPVRAIPLQLGDEVRAQTVMVALGGLGEVISLTRHASHGRERENLFPASGGNKET